MNNLSEHDVVQNIGLGALILQTFVSVYSKDGNNQGVFLPILMPVLPIVFHRKFLDSIQNKQSKLGSFYKALSSDRDLIVGLQERMSDMSRQTFRSLNLAFSSEILTFQPSTNTVIEGTKKPPVNLFSSPELLPLQKGASRLGGWFKCLNLDQICIALNIELI